MPRALPAELAFRAHIGGASPRHSITLAEAERAVAELEKIPAAAERARVVDAFLASAAAQQLTPRAKEALHAFIDAQGAPQRAPGRGDSIVAARAAAQRQSRAGKRLLQRAQQQLSTLLQGPAHGARVDLSRIKKLLRAASHDVADARARLAAFAAQRSLAAAARLLGLAERELTAADGELALLVERARTRGAGLKQRDVLAFKRWLLAPDQTLQDVDLLLSPGLGSQTARYPWDRDDASDSSGTVTTAKAPSDNEDHGGRPPRRGRSGVTRFHIRDLTPQGDDP